MTLPHRTLLLVDDNPADCHTIQRYLRRDHDHGYTFHEAETGAQALACCREMAFDCILIDYNLPDMSGLELLDAIVHGSEAPSFPIVMMTGSGDEKVAVQAIQRGAQDYLVKGDLSAEGLRIAIDNAIEKLRLRRNLEAHQRDLQQQNVELQKRQQENQVLNIRLQRAMAESHHRIKNNLQALTSLVSMHSADDPESIPIGVLKRFEMHIHTLASLHDMLTQNAKNNADFDAIDLQLLLDKLTPMIQALAGKRRVRIDTQEIRLPISQSNAFLLLTNELLSNAIKHGHGDILLSLTIEEDRVHLEVCDDGPGFPADFNARQAANTGLEIIESITRFDLNGEIYFENPPDGGARVRVIFPCACPEVDEKEKGKF